jgi:hypothetical protein
MARRRFLVEPVHDNAAELRGEDARHLARVLRAEPGQQYEISDGDGRLPGRDRRRRKDRVMLPRRRSARHAAGAVQLASSPR